LADDDRWITIDGRRWRRSDPAIPEALRAELVAELMSARRAVAAAKRAEDEVAELGARARVQDAKVALGERGDAWWGEPTEAGQGGRVASTMRALLRHRGGKPICPSVVARSVGGSGWRKLMPLVRATAGELVDDGQLRITQRGVDVPDPHDVHGPVRLALPDRG
jgi:hypothetical protein